MPKRAIALQKTSKIKRSLLWKSERSPCKKPQKKGDRTQYPQNILKCVSVAYHRYRLAENLKNKAIVCCVKVSAIALSIIINQADIKRCFSSGVGQFDSIFALTNQL